MRSLVFLWIISSFTIVIGQPTNFWVKYFILKMS